ncbi:cytochrome c oxidase assembly factor 8 [Leptinotarsa decemlineata]|uniref:cytochrome c oxidase assembly factor 8 n=1 Tax=Leptinotarsa decemlineata TaxID=7539 RepID=UPI000C252C8B|nr:apoptogenic protein 1, mitochondrial [Leptinotarsa decemlineata]
MVILCAKRLFCRGYNIHNGLHVLRRISSSKVPEAVFIENSMEEPVIVMREEDDIDLIGPADPISNLRPIIRKHLANETILQRRLRNLQNETQEWNHLFWTEHNERFKKEQQTYIDLFLKGQIKRQLTADEMSEFYKKFLDENLSSHMKYNREWYKRNFTLLILSLLVNLEKSIHTIKKL